MTKKTCCGKCDKAAKGTCSQLDRLLKALQPEKGAKK